MFVYLCGWISVSMCLYVWDSALASHFTLPLSPDTPQLPASFTASIIYRPAVWIPTGPAACPGSCPRGLCNRPDLGAIHSGKPPVCSLPGHRPREATVEKRVRREKAGSWQHSPLLLEMEISLWPLPRPPFPPHALIQTKYSGSWPRCLWG